MGFSLALLLCAKVKEKFGFIGLNQHSPQEQNEKTRREEEGRWRKERRA